MKNEKNNNYNWLIIACIAGFCVFLFLTFISIKLVITPFNKLKGNNIINKANTIIDDITEEIQEEKARIKDNDLDEKEEEVIDRAIERITGENNKANTYNRILEKYFGTNDGEDVKELIDQVIIKMKKNKEHTIKIIYKDITTSDAIELINLKKIIEDQNKYEVLLDYDNNGYINQITILDY